MSTGGMLSRVRHRRQLDKLGRQAALEIVVGHVAGPPQPPPPLSDAWTRASHVEGTRVNGCGALTRYPSPSSFQALWAACPQTCCFERSWTTTTTTAPASQRHTETNISSAGSACQRVWCSHMYRSAVSWPSSVGSVPVILFTPTWLWTIATHPPLSDRHMDTII